MAVKNGFSPLAQEQPEKDPNLVLPGDRLVLPDGRLLQVQPKQYIYDIAGKEYRRDMARIDVLEQQIDVLATVYASTPKPEIAQGIRERLQDIQRLAVTPKSRQKYGVIVARVRQIGI